MPKCKIARFNMKLNQIYFINLLNNINDITLFIHQYKAINQPLGSMPLDANSLRRILLIQVARVVSPSFFACSSNCWRNSSANLIWYCGDLFSFCGVDMVYTSMYSYLYGNYHNKKVQKKQTPKSISPLLSVLTNNLTKDKTMANLNYTGFTYIFIGILRTDLSNQLHKLRIPAESELQARKKLARDYVLVFAGKIPVKTEEGLSIVGNRCSIQGTTTKDGSRSRYSSGIFLPQIYLSKGNGAYPHTFQKAEFVEWLIRRNKPSNWTNKASRSFAVVETISHPTKGRNLLLTKQKRNPTMKTSQKSTALLAVRSRTPIVFTPAMEVTYA
ncbi:host cell division inhibitor Icd-like protein [Pasteurella multocida]|uniref:host cell division inhibitor Icd-like protein n=2 Tax=Pasteurella multocida TaxID=747 RepID=UPI002B46A782|nr:host cell division inhibitor Icd-like protein [Pasteurella multocida]MEB3477024.1 host cell division inhibitor Icd-like protein [Pasteurella multocida]WRJ98863.1 host cell division inhibitor Icd-like protein [Pasteurella multocida]